MDIVPRELPRVDLRRYLSLVRQGVPRSEAEEIVMAEWRERWARACTAQVAGHLLARGVPPYLALSVVTGWVVHEYGLTPEAVAQTVDWVAARELERRRGERRAS